MMTNNIEQVILNDECTGCGACINICPKNALTYSVDKYNFIIPKINFDLCVNCGLCRKVCPTLTNNSKEVIKAYAAICKDKQILKKSSSGGIFGVLASFVLKNQGVVYGCQMDDNFKVKHIKINKIEDLCKIQKSKYVQSFMNYSYKEVKNDLRKGKKVLFSGTPCEVSALKNYLNNLDTTNLITVDIVCHGVPSQKMFDDYLSNLINKVGKIKQYTFREKKRINNGMQWYSSYTKSNGKTIAFNWTEDSFNYNYMMSNTNRSSCYKCHYTSTKRTSDITLCDYWHWDKYHTDFDKLSSISGVLINSEKGEKILNLVSKDLKIIETNLENIIKHNSCLKNSAKINEKRDIILNSWIQNGYKKIDKDFVKDNKMEIIKGKFRRNLPIKLYSFIGKIKTIIK